MSLLPWQSWIWFHVCILHHPDGWNEFKQLNRMLLRISCQLPISKLPRSNRNNQGG
jgi:hypothetical protein